MWARHHKTPSWFKKLPRGEQIFLLAADLWAIEDESKPRSASGYGALESRPTMSLQQISRIQ